MDKTTLIESVIGAAVVAALVLVAVLGLSRLGDGGADRALFARFGYVGELAPGSDVKWGGIKVGTVLSLRFEPRRREILVSFSVDSKHPVPEDSAATIVADSLLGGAHLRIDPGKSARAHVNLGAMQETNDALDMAAMVGLVIQAGVKGLLITESEEQGVAPAGNGPAR